MMNTIMCCPDLSSKINNLCSQQLQKRQEVALSCQLSFGINSLEKKIILPKFSPPSRSSLPNDGSVQGYKDTAPSTQLRTTLMICPSSRDEAFVGFAMPNPASFLFLP